MKSKLSLVSSFVLAFVFVGCGGNSDNGGSPTVDAGVDSNVVNTDSAVDSAKGETTPDVGTDSKKETATDAPADTAPSLASGTKITDGFFDIAGVTTDDQIALNDSSGGGSIITVVDIAGGTPTSVDPSSQAVFASGKTIFSLNSADMTAKTAKVLAWTKASGVHTIATAASYNDVIDASSDGASVVWVEGVTAVTGGNQKQLKFSKIDGTGGKTLFANAFEPTDGSCPMQVRPVAHGFVVVHCDVATGDAGVTANLDAVDAADGTVRSLATNVSASFVVSLEGGTNVVYSTAAGDLASIPFAGGTSTTIESGGFTSAITSKDAANVVYTTNAAAMKKSPLGTPAPAVVLATKAAVALRASANLASVMYVDDKANITAPSSGGVSYTTYAAFVVDTTAATPTPITLTATSDAAFFGDAFSADGKFAFVQTGTTGSAPTFDLTVANIATKAVSKLTTDAYVQWAYGSAAKLLFNDNWDGSTGTADISTVDLAASPATPAKFAEGAQADMFIDSTKSKAIYSSQANAGKEGIYVFTLP